MKKYLSDEERDLYELIKEVSMNEWKHEFRLTDSTTTNVVLDLSSDTSTSTVLAAENLHYLHRILWNDVKTTLKQSTRLLNLNTGSA